MFLCSSAPSVNVTDQDLFTFSRLTSGFHVMFLCHCAIIIIIISESQQPAAGEAPPEGVLSSAASLSRLINTTTQQSIHPVTKTAVPSATE